MQKMVPENAVLIPHEATKVFRGTLFDVYQWEQQLYDGSYKTFEMLRRPDTVLVMGVVENKLIIINEEQPLRGVSKCLPGGRVDKQDESILAAAKREAFEETGYTFQNYKLLSMRQPQRKIEWFIHLCLAWDVAEINQPHTDAGERISLDYLTIETVKKLSNDRSSGFNEPEALAILENIATCEELIALPEYVGKNVDLKD